MAASTSGAILAVSHQQGPGAQAPMRALAGTQPLGPPHSGQRVVSGSASAIVQPATTGIAPIRAFHSAGPVWWTEVPSESTATVTGMSRTVKA